MRDDILAAKGQRFIALRPFLFRIDTLASLGSVQNNPDVPVDLKAVFRTAFELDPRAVVDLALDRSPYIDQSQSMSLYIAAPTTSVLVRSPRIFCVILLSHQHTP